MTTTFPGPLLRVAAAGSFLALLVGCDSSAPSTADQVAEGKQTFRYDTFGDESKWTDLLRMNEVVSTVDPTTALSVGLKVDAEALPPAVVTGIQNGSISLTDPATTLALLKLNAVVGVKGTVTTVNGADTLTRVGFTCALCHSTVDDSFAPGVGKRLDGWPIAISTSGRSWPCPRARRGNEGHLQQLGQRTVRPAIQPGRQEWSAGHPARLRTRGCTRHHRDR
jgi:hypothetical protein